MLEKELLILLILSEKKDTKQLARSEGYEKEVVCQEWSVIQNVRPSTLSHLITSIVTDCIFVIVGFIP